MARGTQLQQLVYMLRAEIRRSTNVAVGVDDLPDLKQAINKQYAIQRDRFDWPFLKFRFILPLAAAQQYYAMPSFATQMAGVPGTPPGALPSSAALTMSHRHIKRVAAMLSGIPMGIARGITFEDYEAFDYEVTGAVSDPVLKWDVVAGTASSAQIEVWPVPASDTNYLRFFAGIDTPPLVNDTDLCWLDDQLVVLYAAADCLALDMSEPRVGLPPAAQLTLKQADDYFNILTSSEVVGRPTVAIGAGPMHGRLNTNLLIRPPRTP